MLPNYSYAHFYIFCMNTYFTKFGAVYNSPGTKIIGSILTENFRLFTCVLQQSQPANVHTHTHTHTHTHICTHTHIHKIHKYALTHQIPCVKNFFF
jgi:hypothetical protein